MGETTSHDVLVRAFERRLPAIVEEIVRRSIIEVEAYGRGREEAALPVDHAIHAERIYRVLVACLEQDRTATAAEFGFMEEYIERRLQQGISLADFLQTFRIGLAACWEQMMEAGHEVGAAESVLLSLVEPLMEFVNVATTTAAGTFLQLEQSLRADHESVRRDLLDGLLAGRYPTPGPATAAAHGCGLLPETDAVVVSAVEVEIGASTQLHRVANRLAAACRLPFQPLAVTRSDEAIVVVPLGAGGVDLAAIETAWHEFGEDGIDLAVGISTVHHGLRGLPEAYRESCLAREHAGPRGGIRNLGAMGPLEFFATSAQRTLGRLIRDDARAVVVADLRGDGVLAETLETYVDCGLHATRTAERLHVHVNTVQYRLRRLAERSGCDTRLVPDVLELLLAIRVARAETSAADPEADEPRRPVPG